MSDIKKNELVTLYIEDMNNLGAGVAHLEDGRVVFCTGTVIGERVEAKVIKVCAHYLVARCERIIESSDYRAEDFCAYPQSCGGCVFRNITYEHELGIKREYVKNAFRKAGLADVEVAEVATTGKMRNYRNKAQYPLTIEKGRVRAGFFAAKTHRIIPAERCGLQADVFGDIVEYFCDLATSHSLTVYDEESGKGLLRHLYLRSTSAGEVMVCIVINAESFPREDDIARSLCERFENISGVLVNVNKKKTNVVLGERYRTLVGKDFIEDTLLGKRFKITPASFYQVNHDGAELLYAKARELAELGAGGTLIDLYCGTGTIGISMADEETSLIGVEIVESAVKCARENARANGLKNAEFFAADASSLERILGERGLYADVVVIDPPRKGTTPELIEYLARLGTKRIVYVSCDPDTLARDCVQFVNEGYSLSTVYPVDMFPRTGHVESVVRLERRLDN